MQYGLAKTGVGAIAVGGLAVARPVAAAVIGGVLIAVGIALRISGRRKALTK